MADLSSSSASASSNAEKKGDLEHGAVDLEFAVDGDHGTKRHLVSHLL